MLRTLFTISEDYKNRKIFIYGVNRNAINEFTFLAYAGVDVYGFVDLDNRCIGQRFMNRYIFGEKAIVNEKGVVVIIPKFFKKTDVQKLLPNFEICYSAEILDVDSLLRMKKIIIYGIGKRGEEIYSLLKDKKMNIYCVCETEKRRDIWMDMPVHNVKDIKIDSDMAIVIASRVKKNRREMLENVSGCISDIYVDEIVNYASVIEGNIFWVINKAVEEKKRIFLYENHIEESVFMEDILKRYQVPIAGKMNEGMSSLNEFLNDNNEKAVIVILERDENKSEMVCNVLDEMGFSLTKHNYTSIYPESHKYIDGMETKRDCLLGHTAKGNGKEPGYVVYGNKQESSLKILILGNSTSTDGYYRTQSWVSKFYDKLVESGLKVVLYNGCACGFDIVQEMMRLIRDGNVIKPDYVISMSGVNNVNKKKRTNNQFCVRDFLNWAKALDSKDEYESGICDDESLYDFWIRNTKIMKMVCELWGGKFYSFLQPMNIGIKDAGLYEISMYEQDDCLENACIFRECAKHEKGNIYTNLIDIFDTKERMYIDNCHYSNEANDILADIVYDTLLADFKGGV